MITPGEALEFLYKEIKANKQMLAFYEGQGCVSGPLVDIVRKRIEKYEQLTELILKARW